MSLCVALLSVFSLSSRKRSTHCEDVGVFVDEKKARLYNSRSGRQRQL